MNQISVLLERQAAGFRAIVLGLPDCQAEGATRAEALAKVQRVLQARLQTAELVTISLDATAEPPLAGLFKDDPQWDDFQAAIATYRQVADAELEAEYLQLDQGNPAA